MKSHTFFILRLVRQFQGRKALFHFGVTLKKIVVLLLLLVHSHHVLMPHSIHVLDSCLQLLSSLISAHEGSILDI